MKAGFWALAACPAMASGNLAAGQPYQWKDMQGRTVCSDQAPPPSVMQVQQKNFNASVIERGEPYAV